MTPSASYARAAALVLGLTCLLGLFAAGCSDDGKAAETLRAEGFTKIETTGWDPWSCAKDDNTCTGFEATGPSGLHVVGAVGCGFWFKGCTVRITGARR